MINKGFLETDNEWVDYKKIGGDEGQVCGNGNLEYSTAEESL